MTFWKKREFQTLQQAWYKILEDDGFKDHELLINGELVLRQTAGHSFYGVKPIAHKSKAAYYDFMGDHVRDSVFTDMIDYVILSRYVQGKKIKKICAELAEMGEPRCRETIRFKIREYEMQWGLKKYTPKELNKKVS